MLRFDPGWFDCVHGSRVHRCISLFMAVHQDPDGFQWITGSYQAKLLISRQNIIKKAKYHTYGCTSNILCCWRKCQILCISIRKIMPIMMFINCVMTTS